MIALDLKKKTASVYILPTRTVGVPQPDNVLSVRANTKKRLHCHPCRQVRACHVHGNGQRGDRGLGRDLGQNGRRAVSLHHPQ